MFSVFLEITDVLIVAVLDPFDVFMLDRQD
jgi:hypothetical protein